MNVPNQWLCMFVSIGTSYVPKVWYKVTLACFFICRGNLTNYFRTASKSSLSNRSYTFPN